MEGNDGTFPAGQLGDKVLDLISKVVGHAVFHGGGEIQNDLVLRCGVEMLQDCLTDLRSVVHLRTHEGLWRVFIAQIHPLLQHGLAHLVNQVGGIRGDLGDAGHVHMEDHLPLQSGRGIVEMEDHIFGALNGLKCFLDQMGAGLYQYLNGHIIRDMATVDELPTDLILRLRGRRKANLNFFDPDVHQSMEIFQLLFEIHGIYQGLVAIPQVYRAPDGRLGNLLVGPGAVLHLQRDKGNVLLLRIFDHARHPPYDSDGLCAGTHVR